MVRFDSSTNRILSTLSSPRGVCSRRLVQTSEESERNSHDYKRNTCECGSCLVMSDMPRGLTKWTRSDVHPLQ